MYYILKGILVPLRQSTLCLVTILLFSLVTRAQNLTLSSGGQTGTSGTNWSTSGTNPITLSVTGTANVNTSVIEGYLNAGTSVIISNSSVGTTINSNITKSGGGNASLTIKDVGCIKVAANITISSSSNALDLILWADSDNSQGGTVDDFIYLNAGVTISTNGGKIILAGGPDNGSNGGTNGDGIPDGFAWNGSNSVTYGANDVGGLTLGQRAGTGTLVSLLSGGGEIIMRGSTSNNNSYPGITSQSNLKIVSGTGKITMFGKSSSGHGVELTYGTAPSIAISSAATSSPALDLKGTTSASGYGGFWLSNNANGSILFESTAASGGGMTIEGVSSNSSGLWFGVSNTNIITQLLSQSGTITLKGDGGSNASLFLYGDLYIGNRKDATAIQGVTPSVTASTANILIQADDQYTFSNTAGKNVNINSTGSLTMEAYTAGYSGTLSWAGNVAFGSNFSSIVLGESAENYTITLNTSLTSAGDITAYASDFNLANGIGLTSTGAGNININARGSFGTTGTTRRSLTTNNGNINVYADSDASGNGQIDIDYLTFNAGTGTTTLRSETFSWTTAANTDKPYINGTGAFVFEPADASFGGVSTAWFYFDQDANGIGGVTIGKSSSTGNINHETTALTVAGPISLFGSDISINAALTCTSANAAVLVKGSGSVTISAGITTNAGAINIWADSDSNGSGGILVNNNTTLDSRTSADRLATTHTTGGGTITLAGGADDGGAASGTSSLISGLVSGDGIPDGYAVNSGSLAAQTGIVLGTSTASAGQNANVNLYSGGGHIRLFGKVTNNASSPASGPTGIMAFHGHTLNAGTNGDIIFIGNADLTSGSTAIGMDLAAWRSNSYTANGTLRTVNGNIRIIGRATGGTSANLAIAVDGTTGNRNIFAATGSGTITLDGQATGTSNTDCRLTSTDLLAASGDIQVIGQSSGGLSISNWIGDGLYTGQKAASLVTSSSSNILLRANAISTTNTLSVNSSGTFTVEPYGNSFSAGLSWPLSNTTLAGTVSGLTLGKSTNTANITLTAATSIAGPVTLYGSGLTINENLASSASGNISLYGNTLTVAAGKTISSAGNLIIEPQTNGTTIGIAGGAGSLSLPATYFSSNFSNGFAEIRIGNSNAGNITLGAALTLQDPMQLITAGNLALNENITMGANDFTFNGASIVPGSGKYVRSNGTGKMRMTISNSSSKTFPIGTSYYNPVTITNNTGASDQFYATVSDGLYYNGAATGSVTLGGPRVDLTWNIGNTGASTGAGTVDLGFTWVPANNVSGTFVSPKLLHYNGSSWNILSGSPTFDLVAGTLSYTGYSGSFSPFGVGESNFILPVSWLSFTGTAQGKTVVLDWATAAESNNDHYEIERSANGVQYTTIGEVAAAANPAIRNDYQFTDINPLSGTAYYRLKQVDIDGRYRYSTVIAVNYTGNGGFELRVIPGSGLVGLMVPATVNGKADVMIYDAQGRQLQRQTVVAGQQTLTLNAGSSNTIYLIKVVKDGKTLYTGRFML